MNWLLFVVFSVVAIHHIFLSNSVENTEDDSKCEYLAEVLFIFRASYGYRDDFLEFPRKAGYILEDLFARSELWFGPEARIGIVSYQDKPETYFGEPGNTCAELVLPLTNMSQFSNYRDVGKLMARIPIQDTGADADGAVDGIIRGILNKGVGWSESDYDPIRKKPIRRIVVLVTDAYPHMGDSLYLLQPRYTDAIVSFNRSAVEKNLNGLCTEMDFPSNQDVIDILLDHKVSLFIVGWRGQRIPKKGGWPREEYGVPGEVFHYLAHRGYSLWEIGGYFSAPDDYFALFYDDMLNKSKVHYRTVMYEPKKLHDPPTGAVIKNQMLQWHYSNKSCSRNLSSYPPIEKPFIEKDPLEEILKIVEQTEAANAKNTVSTDRVRSSNSLIAGVAGVVTLGGIGIMLSRGIRKDPSKESLDCNDAALGPGGEALDTNGNENREQVAAVTEELYT